MLRSGLKSAYFTTELVDTISFFWVLIPEIRQDLEVKSYVDIDPFIAKNLIKVYREQFKPWYENLYSELIKDEIGNDVPKIEEDKGDIVKLN
jgi:hypothetical protein